MKKIRWALAVAMVSSLLMVGTVSTATAAAPPPPNGCNGKNQYRSLPWYATLFGNYKDESWTNWQPYYSAGKGGYKFTYRVQRPSAVAGAFPVDARTSGFC